MSKIEGQALTTETKKHPLEVFRDTMSKQRGEFLKVLPAHISFEKFQRTVMTAVITNPELLVADRQSLLVSCVKAATDGLMPDNRDAALVVFNTKGKDASGRDVWIKKIQYMPMYAGILKKVRQSGELSSVVTHVVYEKDKFEYVLGDNERILHEPYIGDGDRGLIIAAYCIAKLKDGTVVREVMTFQDIEKVRKSSKAGSMNEKDVEWSKEKPKPAIGDPKGIWKAWYEEMARKTVFRRCAKWLPQQIELVDQVFANDESMEIIDQVDADPSVFIEGEVEALPQPDLKEEVKKKKRASKPVKKDEVPEPDPEQEPENVSRETNEPPAEEKGITTIEEITQKLNEAKDLNEVFDIWTQDYRDDLKAIKANNPQDYADLHEVYKTCSRKFQEE